MKRSRRALTISIVGLVAACSSCHSATPTGTVMPTPSKSSLAPGEAYTVSVNLPFTNTGK